MWIPLKSNDQIKPNLLIRLEIAEGRLTRCVDYKLLKIEKHYALLETFRRNEIEIDFDKREAFATNIDCLINMGYLIEG